MTSGSSFLETKRKAEETSVLDFEEQDLTNRYTKDLFEEVWYIDPMDEYQNDDVNPDPDDYTKTPQ